ncbi:MAG: YkgJ family cysteine cluster protein, partial [Meiothermus sp.]|uniref:YkgJ family cysteine cluster protein n=2 Tax=Meiothermus sp. TaxID=1955249 RepID=UPI0025DEE9D5
MEPVLRQAVALAHQNLEARTAQYLARLGQKVSCRRGCFACCYAWVVVGLAEAAYLREHLEAHLPDALARVEAEGPNRLRRIAQHKHRADFPTTYFLEAHPCPLLTSEGACAVHPHRPLACRGVLTNLEARYCAPGVVPNLRGSERAVYQRQLRAWHGPEHYLRVPWQLSERSAQKLWATEKKVRDFTVIGELVSLIYLLGQADFRDAVLQGPA